MLVVQAGLQHDRVEGEHPGVVGDEQRTPGGRHVLQPAHLDPEPLLVQQPGQRDQQPGIEFRVESELVDLALAGDLAPGEPQRLGQPAAPVIASFPAGGAVGLGTAIVGGPAWGHPGKPSPCFPPRPPSSFPLRPPAAPRAGRSADLPPASRPRGRARRYFLFRRCTRVFRSSLRCFFFAIRLRRFLITEPTTPPSLGIQAHWLATYSPDASRLGPRQRPRVPAPRLPR